MNIRVLFTVISVLLAMHLSSQDWAGYHVGELYPGYVITTDGTKIDGYIERGKNIYLFVVRQRRHENTSGV
jgi:hypothetical protein